MCGVGVGEGAGQLAWGVLAPAAHFASCHLQSKAHNWFTVWHVWMGPCVCVGGGGGKGGVLCATGLGRTNPGCMLRGAPSAQDAAAGAAQKEYSCLREDPQVSSQATDTTGTVFSY
jgi:hypothetical protein